ncbi:lipopolysaccharide biosynthesis protein [Pedobacter xixiisoli]|uniref:Lipopolysaccharide biosynthesis protein n=1 Tax=Pedobacter xixiisoli TaxID=1476464 RepID=A0A286AEL9_9SPHI|nr:lipopolysaccharide biosynthesis protein [Pedobacter xixiisoli]SOD20344.1 hypothetical protein SAMN06297358_4060 [Pedobacter xixiisoli]
MTLGNKLSGKNIIFFSVQTFNLEKEIKRKLEELGAKVSYFDERPSNSNFTKGIIRLKRDLYQKKIDNYYKSILIDTKDEHFDFLFVNRGEVIPAFFLMEFKKLHANCEFIFYTWDSFTNHVHPTTILEHFDRKLTFDPEDATKFNINFRPLFYLDAFKNLSSEKIENDILFLGTAHSDRYKISSEIKNWAVAHKLTMFCYYYMHGRFVYLYKRLFDKTFKQFDYRKLSFTSLTLTDIVSLYQKSNVVLDINHPHQKGLTMRTFEAIGAKKKLITTNKEIAKFPFYSENNVEIINRDNVELNERFFKSDYQPVDEEIYQKLTLEGWLYNIFVDNEAEFWNQCK